MSRPISREEFATPRGRRRAGRALIWDDHGFLRNLYDNTHEIAPGEMWRTFQPGPNALARWKDRGVKTIINLRGPKLSGPLLIEEEACQKLGLNLVTLRAYSREAPSAEFLKNARALFREIAYPAVMHCKSGADRAGLMATLYLFYEKGVPLDQAMEQLSWRYGHVRRGKTGVIDAALNTYVQYAQDKGIDLTDVDAFLAWAETDYDPAAIKRDFQPAWWGAILTDIVLKRE